MESYYVYGYDKPIEFTGKGAKQRAIKEAKKLYGEGCKDVMIQKINDEETRFIRFKNGEKIDTESKCSKFELLSKLNSLIYNDDSLLSLCINDGISLYDVKLSRTGIGEDIVFRIIKNFNFDYEIGLFILDDVKKIEYDVAQTNDNTMGICTVKAIYNRKSKDFTIYEDRF